MKAAGHIVVATLALPLLVSTAQGDEAQLKRGEALLTRQCSRCHAVGRTGDSPRPDAPPFRTLGTHYPVDALEEALGEGIVSGHPDMPEFSFDAPDVGAIIAYLKSIQAR
jgi:mono/diheme cytochrome c family protein